MEKGLFLGGETYSASDFGVPLASPLSGMGCPVGAEGPFGQVGKGRKSPSLAQPRSPLVASPSRDSDSKMVLQVEAISEMDCHSSSRVSLPASDMTVGTGRWVQPGQPRPAPPSYAHSLHTHFC